MKYIIKIQERKWTSNNKKMIHTDEKGRQFIGNPIEQDNVIIEAGNSTNPDGHYEIIKVVGILNV